MLTIRRSGPKLVSTLCAWTFLLSGITLARGDYLVGVVSGFAPGTAPTIRIDLSTGEYSILNEQGRAYNSLAQNSSGELFAGWFNGSGENGRVSKLDLETGAILQTFDAATPGADSSRGLSFSHSDVLYAAVNRNDSSGSPTLDDDLYVFDLANEATALIGSLGFSRVQGLDFSPDGTLYAWDVEEGLLIVNPMTGLAADVSPAQPGTAEIQSLAFTPDGRLFGARGNLYTIDPNTGAFSQLGTGSGIDLRGIEYVMVPEPTCLILVSVTLITPTWFSRKSRAARGSSQTSFG